MGRWARNADVMERLSSDMQERYEFAFAWESACAMYQCVPGLRGFWPMSSIGTGTAIDLSGQGRTLSRSNGFFVSEVLIPCYDAVEPQYLWRGDEAGLDIIGTEGYVADADKGVTIGAWVKFDTAAPANSDTVISKGQFFAAANSSYALYRRSAGAGGTLRAGFSNGVLLETADSAATVPVDEWVFTAAKWSPAVGQDESAVFLNGVKAETTPTGLLTLLNSGSPLQIMGMDNGVGGSHENTSGRVSLAFLSAMALHDGAIIALYERTRALFGV